MLEVVGGATGLGLGYGSARTLRSRASFKYPAVAVLAGLCIRSHRPNLDRFWYLIIPDEISLFLAILGLFGFGLLTEAEMIERMIGAVAGGGFLLLVAGLGYLMYRREAMGMGDVKLLASVDFFLDGESYL